MKSSVARHFLMQALAMKRSKIKELKQRVLSGCCILDDCKNPLGSRGLCDHHRQQWYRTLKKQNSPEDKIAFEEKSIQLGLILPSGEQDEWLKAGSNPFEKAVS